MIDKTDKEKETEEKENDESSKPFVNIERALDEEKPASSKYFYVILAVIIIILGSLLAYRYFGARTLTIEDLHDLNMKGKLSPDGGYIYNGFSFVKSDGLWWTEVEVRGQMYKVPLHFGPKDVENVTQSGKIELAKFNNGTQIFMVINPLETPANVALAASELSQNIVTVVKRQPVGACDRNETSMCIDRPIVTCESYKPMIYLLNEAGPSIQYNGSCITLRGEEYDLVRAADRLIFEWYNVYE